MAPVPFVQDMDGQNGAKIGWIIGLFTNHCLKRWLSTLKARIYVFICLPAMSSKKRILTRFVPECKERK